MESFFWISCFALLYCAIILVPVSKWVYLSIPRTKWVLPLTIGWSAALFALYQIEFVFKAEFNSRTISGPVVVAGCLVISLVLFYCMFTSPRTVVTVGIFFTSLLEIISSYEVAQMFSDDATRIAIIQTAYDVVTSFFVAMIIRHLLGKEPLSENFYHHAYAILIYVQVTYIAAMLIHGISIDGVETTSEDAWHGDHFYVAEAAATIVAGFRIFIHVIHEPKSVADAATETVKKTEKQLQKDNAARDAELERLRHGGDGRQWSDEPAPQAPQQRRHAVNNNEEVNDEWADPQPRRGAKNKKSSSSKCIIC